MKLPFFTIGHSNRNLEEFVAMLQDADVRFVADIRKMPRSRANPQFNSDVLPGALARYQIGYAHIAALGGLRAKASAAPAAINGFWENRSFHNYADYALTPAFRTGLEQLRAAGRKRRCAFMCSEAVWWRCHRRIVTDYLIASGEQVFHIMGEGRVEPAQLTGGAAVQPDHTVFYPAA